MCASITKLGNANLFAWIYVNNIFWFAHVSSIIKFPAFLGLKYVNATIFWEYIWTC